MVADDRGLREGARQVGQCIDLQVVQPRLVEEAVLREQREALAPLRVVCGVLLRGAVDQLRRIVRPSQRVPDALHERDVLVVLQGRLATCAQAKIGMGNHCVADPRKLAVDLDDHVRLLHGLHALLDPRRRPTALHVHRGHDLVALPVAPDVLDVVHQLLAHVGKNDGRPRAEAVHKHRMILGAQVVHDLRLQPVQHLDRTLVDRPTFVLRPGVMQVVVRIDDDEVWLEDLLLLPRDVLFDRVELPLKTEVRTRQHGQ
mmetsp:Transcript_15800/g.45032  ORF Transcript_15800/g.45032 Transcript_15800/m.45032 type:complete len:258 (+) Transcript_15800:499-1272(+)